MSPVRLLLAAFAGLALASLVVMGAEAIAHQVMPSALLPIVAAGYAVAALLGGGLAAALGGRWAGLACGAVLLGLVIFNLVSLPHPAWFWVAGPAATLAGTAAGLLAAAKAVVRRSAGRVMGSRGGDWSG